MSITIRPAKPKTTLPTYEDDMSTLQTHTCGCGVQYKGIMAVISVALGYMRTTEQSEYVKSYPSHIFDMLITESDITYPSHIYQQCHHTDTTHTQCAQA